MTVHRIGGTIVQPLDRRFEAWTILRPQDRTQIMVQGQLRASDCLNVEFSPMEPAMPDWWSGRMQLSSIYGQPLGGYAPFLLYGKPCDVPHYASFQAGEYGVFTVGVRCLPVTESKEVKV